jgi:ketosteroid isomerase-like protein
VSKEKTMNDERVAGPEQILNEMTAAFARKDLEAVVALFAEDASVESYLVVRVFKRKEGVCRGRSEIRELIGALLEHGTPWGGHAPPLVRGNTIAVEYTRASSDTETFSVDIIEVKDGKIQSLRAYAGWRGVLALRGEAQE